MPPWLLALVVLLAVCVIGWYVIYSRHAGVPSESEGFDTASRAALKACETAFTTCLNDGGNTAACTTAYNTCVVKVSNPSVSTVDNAPSTGTSASSAVTARGTPTVPAVDADYQALAGQATTGQTATLTPELKTFMEQVKGKMSTEYPAPSATQLNAAQGQDATGSVVVPGGLLNDPAVYKAFQQIIKPHETPLAQQPGLTANQRGVDGVQAGAILTPSMRQQIRDDVKKAVGEELGAIQNEYEITYDQQ
jgi:hypothetical protein